MSSDGPENFIDSASVHELRPLDLRDAEKIKLEKEREELLAYRDECRARRRKSLVDLWRDWISLGVLIVTALTGVGTIVVGASTGTTQVLLAGVAVLSGASGSAVLGRTRNRSPDCEDKER